MEKIIFLMDISYSMDLPFVNDNTNKVVVLDYLKSLIKMFMYNKSKKCEFCVCVLTNQCLMLTDFTNDLTKLGKLFNGITGINKKFKNFDMNSVFEFISQKVKTPKKDGNGLFKYYIRTVFFYSRNKCPNWGEDSNNVMIDGIKKLILKPFFFFDTLYFGLENKNMNEFIHNLTKPNNKTSKNYFFNSIKSKKELDTAMAVLTANPFCRNDQNNQINSLDKFRRKLKSLSKTKSAFL